MKLELKHLAPYLPYRLKFVRGNSGYLEFVMDCAGSCYLYSENKLRYDYRDVRPILRPLSDLELDEFTNKIFNIEYIIDKETDADLGYYEWCFLFSEHFDVFGLIEAGLAIDINTLEQ
jgi:hypothetical protein